MKKKIILFLVVMSFLFVFLITVIAISLGMFLSTKDKANTNDDNNEVIFFDIEGVVSGNNIVYTFKYDGITVENIKGKIRGNSLNGSLKKGGRQKMEIPDPPASRDVQSFMAYTSVTSTSSAQYKVLNAKGVKDVGIYRKKGDGYFVALGTYYGIEKGTKYEIHFIQEDGSKKVITAYLGDTKADGETDAKHQYHLHDKSIVEFITAKGTNGVNVNRTQSQINKDFGTLDSIYLADKVTIDFSGKIIGTSFSVKGNFNGKPLVASGEIIDGKLKGTGTIGNFNSKHNNGKFGFPLAGNNWALTSPFGPRNFKLAPFHTGIDYGAPRGTPILASQDGVVVEARANEYGLGVKIDHGNGYYTVYGHMSKITTREGKKVKKGEKIGEVGMTGLATGNHLHFEIRKGKNDMGHVIDPAPLLEGQR